MHRFALTVAALFVGCALPLAALAQAPVEDRFPGADETKPGQQPAAKPAAPAKPAKPAKSTKAATPAATEGETPKPKRAAAAAAPPTRAIACSGQFAKDANHLKLAQAFGSQNVTFDDVDGPGGSKIKATVLFPNDPKRRLEVMWAQAESRSDTQLIAINGQSAWSAPKGLKLGLTLAAVEKLNGKPFRLTGFDKDNAGMVQSWEDGALTELPGGCKVSLRFEPDPKVSPEVKKDVAVDKQFGSNDAAMKKAAPKVVEILIGY
jgi:hypothetical protein